MTGFAELCAASNFSFLRGAAHPQEMVLQAEAIGLAGIAIADRNTVAGVVRGLIGARDAPGIKYKVGCRLAFRDGTPDVFAWPRDRPAWGRLTRLLTEGNMRAAKGECHLDLPDLLHRGEGLVLGVVPPPRPDAVLDRTLAALRDTFPDAVRLTASMTYGSADQRRLFELARVARRFGVPLLATNVPLYHHPDRRPLQDVVTCIREHVTLAEAGKRLEANAERHLKPPAEMVRLFREAPEAVRESLAVLEELDFALTELQYHYPEEPLGDAATPQEALQRLVDQGARRRYPEGVPEKVSETIRHEMRLIGERDYARYFLTVHEIVKFAREERGILCQGRGSAANSTVCFCLGITEVDPAKNDLLFERFLSPERREPPDIDVDFEHERREEVMQHIYETYGRERAGIAATVITYRSRSAIREVGKAFGLSEDTVGALSGSIWGWSSDGVAEDQAKKAGLDPAAATTQQMMKLTAELIGFPRHLSQHVGGYVITRDRLDESVPIGNAAMADRTFIEWDKDDLDAVGMMKVDVLALGMLTCIRKAFDFLEAGYGFRPTLASLQRPEREDEAVYRMLCRADSVGVFQVESRAQMTMLPRLRPREFYDLVIEVAIVRPGPIQGDMVHPYLRRRQKLEEVFYPSPSPEHGDRDELEKVLHRTLGVPLFQEQAMKIAIVAAGFSPAESDGLRRAMATFRHNGTIDRFKGKFIDGMVRRGYEQDFAERCFRQIEGFGDYGFPESHAFSFALLVYASAWIKCHYPDVFCAALLNSLPMGFYAPAQIVRDVREHGVAVREVDVNFSDWDNRMEKEEGAEAAIRQRLHPRHADMAGDIRSRHAVRLGLRQVTGLAEKDAERLMAVRGGGYDSVRDLWLRTGLKRHTIERLADADAFRSLGLDRRDALWAAQALEGAGTERLPLFDTHADIRREPDVALPPMPLGEHVVHDYRFLSLSLKAHPVGFLREKLRAARVIRNQELDGIRSGRWVTVSGLVLVRQRPGSASGVIFMTLEDETGIANIVVWPKTFERFRPVVLGSRLVTVSGRVQNESNVIHVVANRLEDRTDWLAALSAEVAPPQTLSRADGVKHGSPDTPENVHRIQEMRKHARAKAAAEVEAAARAGKVMPKGRNFH